MKSVEAWVDEKVWEMAVTFFASTFEPIHRLVVSDYFLNEDAFGKVHAEGDPKVHVARVERRNLELDRRFQLNFNTAFASGPARPHGVAFK